MLKTLCWLLDASRRLEITTETSWQLDDRHDGQLRGDEKQFQVKRC